MDASSDIFDVELERAACHPRLLPVRSHAHGPLLSPNTSFNFIPRLPQKTRIPRPQTSNMAYSSFWALPEIFATGAIESESPWQSAPLVSRSRDAGISDDAGRYVLDLQQHHLRGPAQGPRGEYSILSNRPRGPWLNRLSRVPELQRQRTKGHPRNSRSPDPPPQALVQNSATCPDPEPPPPTLSPCAAPPALDASHDAQYALSFASDTDPKPSVVFNVAKYVSEHETLFHSDIVIRYYPRTPRGIPLLVALRSYRPRLADQYSCLASSLQGLACWMVFSIGRDYRRIQVPYYLNECLIRHRDHRLDSQLESGLDWTSYLKSVQTRLGLSFQLCCCILQFGRVSTSFHSIADESIHLVKLE
ncbi:hypothetical protein C8R44DRAFT_877661 [Mycena epipterygia]|nr:hypothetical protein C8R44DRAFT_877661 [Mycena epipterygia]